MNDVAFDPETGEILEQPQPTRRPPPPVHDPDLQPPKPRRSRRKKPNGNGRMPVPKDETKRQKFLRLANQRFDKIVRAILHMRGLGRNQSAYEYGDTDIDRISDLLVAELEAMKAEMKRRGRPIQTKLDLQ